MKRKSESPEAAQMPGTSPFASSGWAPAAPEPAPAGPLETLPEPATWPHAGAERRDDQATTVAPGWAEAPGDSSHAERFDVSRPLGEKNPDAVIASALLDEPQEEGLRYLLNYANKSIRKNRAVQEQDRDDLLHEIYMEWWICVGFEVASLPRLLEPDSHERQSLRESIYRVFGRYRYHKTAHRTEDLTEGDCPDPSTLVPGERRDFALDLENWLSGLPDLEAKIIDLYYFQHKTMEEIGVEIGLAKQRISEIHKRALARHPEST